MPTFICDQCSKPYQPTDLARVPNQRFCCTNCRVLWHYHAKKNRPERLDLTVPLKDAGLHGDAA
jgi:hypothetical protein